MPMNFRGPLTRRQPCLRGSGERYSLLARVRFRRARDRAQWVARPLLHVGLDPRNPIRWLSVRVRGYLKSRPCSNLDLSLSTDLVNQFDSGMPLLRTRDIMCEISSSR